MLVTKLHRFELLKTYTPLFRVLLRNIRVVTLENNGNIQYG